MQFRILYQDQDCVAIDKPGGFHVHPPEDTTHRIANHTNCLYILNRQIGKYLYPVHRLDRATSGVLLYALNPEFAHQMALQFQEHRIIKTYFCITRGWTPKAGTIERPLQSENKTTELQASTDFEKLAQIELQHKVGKYSTARYSLLKVLPKTGRLHQIRRHLRSESHPLVGDTNYGDIAHNRFFKDELKLPGLMLKAYSLEFTHPRTEERILIHARWGKNWIKAFDLFGVCPWTKH